MEDQNNTEETLKFAIYQVGYELQLRDPQGRIRLRSRDGLYGLGHALMHNQVTRGKE